MSILKTIFLHCLLLTSFAATGKDGLPMRKVLEASEMLNGKRFLIRLFVNPMPESLRELGSSYNPIGGSWTYTDRMEVGYGGRKIDLYPETYLHLLDPQGIHSIEIAPNKMLSFQIRGSDASATYNYRFYIDPKSYRLVRVDHVWPEDGIGGPGMIERYKTKPIKIKRYEFKRALTNKE